MLETMERNRNIIDEEISTLVYYMNGGLDYNDMKIRNAYALGVHEETSDVAFQ